MALGGRHLVKAAVGEDVTEEEMGGSAVHTKISRRRRPRGRRRRASACAIVREYLSFFPQHNREPPPVARDRPIPSTAGSRSSTTSCRPRRGARTTCARSITAIVDDGDVFWMKPEWAKNLVTGLARVGGQPVGIVANQPMVLGGALDVNAADKAARFVWLCDAFNIPLVFLHDVPGFIVGSAVEKQGIIRHGAKMLFAVSEATVPKISRHPAQELRRRLLRDERARVRSRLHRGVADGGDRGDGSRRRGEHHPPHALEAIEDDDERAAKRLELAEEIRANIDPYIAAGHAQLDDVIDPADTRAAIARGLRITADKQVDRPWRKHGVLPV